MDFVHSNANKKSKGILLRYSYVDMDEDKKLHRPKMPKAVSYRLLNIMHFCFC